MLDLDARFNEKCIFFKPLKAKKILLGDCINGIQTLQK